ncbi:putative nucleotidase YqfW [Sporosarcina sp. NCCP-2716]|uniref:5' nucleotidase, NT5C type n=1 Tax=Sporosarcina sp. NCCP-2716 TaxID=2943679 RepID=UPI00203E512B|nr:hypothetical protein [Sporosarcina sp. NCCP-2716]GKV68071.1 putative nucleotidase YqfW [Sporosarcina sp. NCCP-2716]
MKKYRFGIDIDGTVTTPSSLLPHINRKFGCNLVLDDIREYDLTAAFDVDPDVFHDWYKETEAEICLGSSVQKYAKLILEDWQRKQAELYYISARGPEVLDATLEWFRREQIPYDHVELIGSHRKIETARRFGTDVFFEDKHDNAVDLHEELGIPVILFDTPYNRDVVPDGVIRVHTWKEADEWIQQHFFASTVR